MKIEEKGLWVIWMGISTSRVDGVLFRRRRQRSRGTVSPSGEWEINIFIYRWTNTR